MSTPLLFTRILSFLYDEKDRSIDEIVKATNGSRSGIRSYLYQMKMSGLIEPHPTFRGVYHITEQGKKQHKGTA